MILMSASPTAWFTSICEMARVTARPVTCTGRSGTNSNTCHVSSAKPSRATQRSALLTVAEVSCARFSVRAEAPGPIGIRTVIFLQ